MKHIDLHPAARREWEDAVAFYAECDEKLASDFNRRIRDALRGIALDPYRFPLVQDVRPLRKCLLERFPFTILYLNYPERIWVVAIAHGSRRPGFWTDRLHS